MSLESQITRQMAALEAERAQKKRDQLEQPQAPRATDRFRAFLEEQPLFQELWTIVNSPEVTEVVRAFIEEMSSDDDTRDHRITYDFDTETLMGYRPVGTIILKLEVQKREPFHQLRLSEPAEDSVWVEMRFTFAATVDQTKLVTVFENHRHHPPVEGKAPQLLIFVGRLPKDTQRRMTPIFNDLESWRNYLIRQIAEVRLKKQPRESAEQQPEQPRQRVF